MAMVVDNKKMDAAKRQIDDIEQKMKTAATEFIGELTYALSTFEGETKDALMLYKIGAAGTQTEGTLAYFVETQVPSLVNGLGTLLEGNRSTIEECDKKLAEAIAGNGN